jgi:hypothetical protein
MRTNYPTWHHNLTGFHQLRHYWKLWQVMNERKKERCLEAAGIVQKNQYKKMMKMIESGKISQTYLFGRIQ